MPELSQHTFPNFEYKYFVRYVANNCDSEQMVKNPGLIDETFVVGNMLEYLEHFWRWGDVKRNYSAPELNSQPDAYNRNQGGGHPKQIDCICFSKEGKYKLCIEVKYVRGDTNGFPQAIMRDIFRLKQLKGDNTIGGTRRCILIAGQRSAMEKVFEKKCLGEILRFPTIGILNFVEEEGKQPQLEEQQVVGQIIRKEKYSTYSVKEKCLRKYEGAYSEVGGDL